MGWKEQIEELHTSDERVTALLLQDHMIGDDGGRAAFAAFLKNRFLVEANLQHNNFSDELKDSLLDFVAKNKTIKTLNLGENKFTDETLVPLAGALAQQSVITRVSMLRTMFTAESIAAWVEMIKINRKLILTLDNWAGFCVHATSNTPTYTAASFQRCPVSEERGPLIAAALKKNSTLKNFELNFNDLHASIMNQLCAAVGDASSLETLKIVKNNIEDDASSSLCHSLTTTQSIKFLKLEENNLSEASWALFASCLQKSIVLKDLKVSMNPMTDVGAQHLQTALAANTSLETLWLEQCEISDAGGAAIARGLAANKSIVTCSLAENRLGDEFAAEIASCLQQNSTLEKLSVGGNEISDAGGVLIVRSLKTNSVVKDIRLPGNNLGDKTAHEVKEMLLENTALRVIDLRDSKFEDMAGKAFSDMFRSGRPIEVMLDQWMLTFIKALQHDPSSVKIKFVKEGLGNAIGITFAELLAGNIHIKELDFRGNALTDEAGLMFAKALRSNGVLEVIHLGLNNLTDTSGKKIATSLVSNTHLHTINLSFNNVGDETAEAFAAVLKTNGTLRKIDLSYCQLTDRGLTALVHCLNDNNTLVDLQVDFNNHNAELWQPKLKDMLTKNGRNAQALHDLLKTARDSLQRPAIVFCGPEKSGKSSLLAKLRTAVGTSENIWKSLTKLFTSSPLSSAAPSSAADENSIQISTIAMGDLQFQAWDLSGNADFFPFYDMLPLGPHCIFVLVFNVADTEASSEKTLNRWLSFIKGAFVTRRETRPHVLLVGTLGDDSTTDDPRMFATTELSSVKIHYSKWLDVHDEPLLINPLKDKQEDLTTLVQVLTELHHKVKSHIPRASRLAGQIRATLPVLRAKHQILRREELGAYIRERAKVLSGDDSVPGSAEDDIIKHLELIGEVIPLKSREEVVIDIPWLFGVFSDLQSARSKVIKSFFSDFELAKYFPRPNFESLVRVLERLDLCQVMVTKQARMIVPYFTRETGASKSIGFDSADQEEYLASQLHVLQEVDSFSAGFFPLFQMRFMSQFKRETVNIWKGGLCYFISGGLECMVKMSLDGRYVNVCLRCVPNRLRRAKRFLQEVLFILHDVWRMTCPGVEFAVRSLTPLQVSQIARGLPIDDRDLHQSLAHSKVPFCRQSDWRIGEEINEDEGQVSNV